jgi:hypothetical protein
MLFLGNASRNEIFDIDGYRKMSVTGLKVGKFRVPGFWLLNSKLETNQPTAKTFYSPWHNARLKGGAAES